MNIPANKQQKWLKVLFWSIPLLLYAAMRVWYFYDPPAMPRDAVFYLHRAEEFISGGWNSFGDDISLRHRLYIAFISGGKNFFGISPLLWGSGVSLISGLATQIFAMLWIREIFPGQKWLIWSAGILFAVNPVILTATCVPLREAIFIMFSALALFTLTRWFNTGKYHWQAIAGAAAALGMTVRLEGIDLVLFSIGFAVFSLMAKKHTVKQTLIGAALFFVSFLLFLTPYLFAIKSELIVFMNRLFPGGGM